MSDPQSVQDLLFQKIRLQLPDHTSLVDELAEILNISADGVYRRQRGETALRLDEALLLCRTFGLSLDELAGEEEEQAIVFNPSGYRNSQMDFETYLGNLLQLLSGMQQKGVRNSFYAAKDIPIFHLFQFPDLARFKMFFWQKTIFNAPHMADAQFELGQSSEKQDRCVDLCRQLADKYALVPGTEIWNTETPVSFIKQIIYYYESGLFKSRSEAMKLCDQVEALFQHIKQEAEYGYKFLASQPPNHRIENFQLYYNDLVLIDNIISVEFENHMQTYLIYNSIEYLSTTQTQFSGHVNEWLRTLTRKSDLISKVSERQRNRFFLQINDKIDRLKQVLA